MNTIDYPADPFRNPGIATKEGVTPYIDAIEEFPALLRTATAALSDSELETKTEKGVWTIRQVVHHIADSHIHAFVRFKLAMTEENPAIRPYDESLWSEMIDNRTAPVAVSLSIIDGVHSRWVTALKSLDDAAFHRTYFHSEMGRAVPLFEMIPLYAWHGRYHLGFIVRALQ